MKKLDYETLEKLPAKRLLAYFRGFRNILSSIYRYNGPRCCEICHEFIGSATEWEEQVMKYARPIKQHLKLVKGILDTKGHISRRKPKERSIKKIKVSGPTRGRGRYKLKHM